MKAELPIIPQDVREEWPGQFTVFSWLSFAINLPSPIFVVTTLKENGRTNAALNAWGMFAGTGREPKFMMTVDNSSDTCRLLKSGGEFVVNLASADLRGQLFRTIEHYPDDVDELSASGLTPEPSRVVKPPRVKEAWGHFECVVEWTHDVEEQEKRSTLIMGRVVAAAMDEECMQGSPREAFQRRQLPYYVAEFYDHAARAVTVDGWTATLDLSPLPRTGTDPGLAGVSLLVDRYAECFRFYRDVIGWPVVSGDEESGHAVFAAGETTLTLFTRAAMQEVLGPGDRPDRVVIAFATEDVGQLCSAMQERGATLVVPPQDRPDWGVRNAYLQDPDGNTIAIRAPLRK